MRLLDRLTSRAWTQANALVRPFTRGWWVDGVIVLALGAALFGLLQVAREWTGMQRPAVEIDLYSNFHSSQIGPGMQNYAGWRNERADRLLEQIRRTLDDDRRNGMQRELQHVLYEEQPFTFTFVQSLSALVKKKVHGVYTSIQQFQERDMWIPRSQQ